MGNQCDELVEAVKTGRLLFESAFFFSQFSPVSMKGRLLRAETLLSAPLVSFDRLRRGHQ